VKEYELMLVHAVVYSGYTYVYLSSEFEWQFGWCYFCAAMKQVKMVLRKVMTGWN